MSHQPLQINTVSLFSGCGGGDLGLQGNFNYLGKKYKPTGFKVVWANDVLPFAVETYRQNFGDHIVSKDITQIKISEIPDHEMLVGGFPCQTFSMVGGRKGVDDPRGILYKQMIRVIKAKKPKVFIGENVKGLISISKGKVFAQMIEDFRNTGYNITYKVLNASHYGIPQKRERVFIVGVRKDLENIFVFDEAPNIAVSLKNVVEDNKLVDKKYYFSQRALDGLKKANKAFNKGRAQSLEGPSNTISTHLSKVSLNGTDPVLMTKPGIYRRFTPLEAARIQSFPDTFNFVGSEAKQYIQIGNAIPPVLMWHVVNQIKTQIFDSKRVYKEKIKRNNIVNKIQKYDRKVELAVL